MDDDCIFHRILTQPETHQSSGRALRLVVRPCAPVGTQMGRSFNLLPLLKQKHSKGLLS